MYDLIIIGGGPAGMTAGIYAARQKLNTVLITSEFGGQMTKKEVEIENFPGMGKISAQELINRFREHLQTLPVEIVIGEVSKLKLNKKIFFAHTSGKIYEGRAVIVATGANPRFLNVPGEKELVGRGVGYCVTCDGPLFTNRDVAIVGGGNAAFEAAIFLSRFAKRIYIIDVAKSAGADVQNQEIVSKIGRVKIIAGAKVLQIKGRKFVDSLVCEDIVSGKRTKIAVEGVFVKIGHEPASGIIKSLAGINEKKEVRFNHATNQTKTPGLFVAGDVTDIKYKQIIIACGEGAKAAMGVREFMKTQK